LVQALHELLEDDDKFGFLIMDGNGALFGTLQGSNKEVLHKFSVDLPKKHGRGGQSALRFARLRLEKRHNYVRKVRRVAREPGCHRTVADTLLLLLRAGRRDGRAAVHLRQQVQRGGTSARRVRRLQN
jgi:peptide subunit release factor 1 (eRF1)